MSAARMVARVWTRGLHGRYKSAEARRCCQQESTHGNQHEQHLIRRGVEVSERFHRDGERFSWARIRGVRT
jgi:hypothetical protein